jgi:GTPase Era involved in 16S rRNA processing
MANTIIVLGPPGSGKSSFANLLTQNNSFPVSSTEQTTTQNIHTASTKDNYFRIIDCPSDLNDQKLLNIISTETTN